MTSQSPALQLRAVTLARERPQMNTPDSADSTRDYHPNTKGFNTMTEQQSPHNRTTVPVLDRHGQPLAPARPSRVRRWLESGRAHKVWVKGIFAVQLNDLDATTATTGDFAFNMDPGKTSGVAITRESPDGKCRTIVGAYEHQHRNQEIHRNLDSRRDCRRARRYRLRNRPARFNNRANARAEGWLPPSIRSLVEDTEVLVQTMLRLYPIRQLRAEYLRFDTQLMQNPDIKGAEYQQGTLQGWQLRNYILHRDSWQCQYCDQPSAKNHPLTLDHVIPESKGGPTVVGNLVAACQPCNTQKTNRSLAGFLAKDPERLDKIQKQVDQVVRLTSTGHLNSVMPAMLRVLENTGPPVTISDGVSTAYTRDQLDIPKTHVNDAACLDLPTAVNNLNSPVTVLKRQRRHTRQAINCNTEGSPYSKDFPAYSRLPRSSQGYTTPPAHSVGPRRLRGIRTGDIVRISHHTGQTYTGRATLGIKNREVKIKGRPTVSVSAPAARLIVHGGRWSVSLRPAASDQSNQ